MKLYELVGEHHSELAPVLRQVEIRGLAIDSRAVQEGDAFFALPGWERDGHDFIADAVERGARLIVHTKKVEPIFGVLYLHVDDVYEALSEMANAFYGAPSRSMRVYGVTGTNGKSTTACLIEYLLNAKTPPTPCGYSGTIAVRYGEVSREPEKTTPDVIALQAILREMRDHGMEAVSMEVSSHGLMQHRVDGIDFDVAIFTNLSREHLDYHKTMENYFQAKERLFTGMKPEGLCVLNREDSYYERLRASATGRTVSYGFSPEADYCAEAVQMTTTQTRFTLVVSVDEQGQPQLPRRYEVQTNLVARYNILNLLAALAAVHGTGTPMEELVPLLGTIDQVAGRMEAVPNDEGIAVLVDYAHTPDGYEKLFAFIQEVRKPSHRVYAVFGSAGRRDQGKRPLMGQLAAAACDRLYLTEEDPRDLETPHEISRMIQGDLPDEKVCLIDDRYEAIARAIADAEPGDLVLILGKGDELFMARAGGEEPWMGDPEAARRALAERKARRAVSDR